MKVYVQFKVLSTGYIPNTIPPQFSEDFKKPIDMLGSEGVHILDARLGFTNLVIKSLMRLNKINRSNYIVGFDIIRSDSFSKRGTVIYSKILF